MQPLIPLVPGVEYDPNIIQCVLNYDGTADLWRHDGEATAEVFLGLTCQWVSRVITEDNSEVVIYHQERTNAVNCAIDMLTSYHRRNGAIMLFQLMNDVRRELRARYANEERRDRRRRK